MTSAAPLRVHVLYESSSGNLPHGCSEIRLLRPLSHPAVAGDISLTFGLALPNHPFDVLIVERLWDHSCDWRSHRRQLERLRQQGVTVIFEIDDDLLTVNSEPGARDWPTETQRMWLRQIMRYADGIIVSTVNLADRLRGLNAVVEVVPNALDDRLFGASRDPASKAATPDRVVFGYMGTFTHVDDLLAVVQPLRHALTKHRGRVQFEIVGVGDAGVLNDLLREHPVRFLTVPAEAVQYEKFAAWMQANLRWDFGIAPLLDSTFTRSKSDIKFLDYGVQGIPGIFSAVPAYLASVRQMENGILADNVASWSAALDTLIADTTTRILLAQRAHRDVWSGRMLSDRATEWVAAVKGIVDRASRQPRPVRSFAAPSFGTPQKNMTRNEKILFGCAHGRGLEIGASYNPVAPKRAGFQVEILDHADADALRAKYRDDPTVDVANIEEVDYVWTGEPLHETTGKENHYDWIVASHVIEHTPDMVSFVRQCEHMLKPGGLLCLAVPDHRYCFDVFRPASTPGDVIQAYLENRRRHTLGTLWDANAMVATKGMAGAWRRGHLGEYRLSNDSIEHARAVLAEAQRSDAYMDAHNWRFTPSSFKLIMLDIGLLGYTTLASENFFDTEGCEFIVQLKKGTGQSPPAPTGADRLSLLKAMLDESLELARS